MADQALSDLPAITNINTDDLILISQNAGVGVYNSRQITANNFDMVSGVRNYGATTSDPSSPTPQDGDIYYNTNNKVWKYYDSGRSSWVVISSFASETITSSSHTAGSSNENVILADATSNAITINLPAAANYQDDFFIVKKVDSSSNEITIDANGSETIDGDLTKTIAIQYVSIKMLSNGSNWFII